MKGKPARLLHPCLLLAIAMSLLSALTGCRLYKADAKVAFLGDSITEQWHYPKVDLGIYGQTTAQMLERFPAEIPGHGYKQVVILGGTNDVLLGINPAVTVHNLELLGDDTVRAGAQPVLCEVPPIFHGGIHNGKPDPRNYSQPVRQLNAEIVSLAEQHGWRLVDYYHPLLGHPSFSSDGVHILRRGYLVMEFELLRSSKPRQFQSSTAGARRGESS